MADKETLTKRLSACKACPNFTVIERPLALYIGCQLCGCASVRIQQESFKCPDNPPRW